MPTVLVVRSWGGEGSSHQSQAESPLGCSLNFAQTPILSGFVALHSRVKDWCGLCHWPCARSGPSSPTPPGDPRVRLSLESFIDC